MRTDMVNMASLEVFLPRIQDKGVAERMPSVLLKLGGISSERVHSFNWSGGAEVSPPALQHSGELWQGV